MEALAAMGLVEGVSAAGAGAAGAAGGAASGGLMAMPSMAAGLGSMLGPAGALSAEGLVAPSVGVLMSASSIPAAASGASPFLQNAGLGMGIMNQGKALLAPPSPPGFLPSNAPGSARSFSSPAKVVNTAMSPMGGQGDILALLTQLLRQRGAG